MKRTIQGVLILLAFAGDAFAHKGHEHVSNIPANVQWGLQGLNELINVHPLFVHFPIALLLTAIAFYFLGVIFRKEELLQSGRWSFYAGTLSAVVAVLTGLQAASTVPHGGDLHQTLMAHQYTGFAILGLSLFLSVWLMIAKAAIPQKGKPLFLTAILLLGAIIIQQADFGGRLVFLHGIGIGKKSMMEGHAESSQERSEERSTLPAEPSSLQDGKRETTHGDAGHHH
jgi:uncharacterized membrane protein